MVMVILMVMEIKHNGKIIVMASSPMVRELFCGDGVMVMVMASRSML